MFTKKIHSIVFILFTSLVHAQNLVPNPSFEALSSSISAWPCSCGQLSSVWGSPPADTIYLTPPWYSPSGGSPDITFDTVTITVKDCPIEVYPNPATDNLFILFTGYGQLLSINLEIYNMLGEQVLTKQIASCDAPTSVTIAPIASGCYILVLKNGSSILYKDKLVIIK
ncbi:MAG: T9SS type A sorting domain-containing protein [Bacteroidota bacterium]